ncbi:tetratricopeptide repeat protein [bacterium]|nr:tetratricopeptide repeat protein [bacterium]
MKRCNRFCRLGLIVLSAALIHRASAAEPTNTTNAAPVLPGAAVSQDDEKWSRHVVENYQRYLDQQQVTLEAIEQSRLAAAAAAAAARQNAEETEVRLRRIEAALLRQHSQELTALQDSHRTVLVTLGVFAVLGLGGLLAVVFLVRRAGRRAGFAEAPTRSPLSVLAPRDAPALGNGNTALAAVATADQANAQFLGALERLERRIQEMEQAAPLTGVSETASRHGRADAAPPTRPARIGALLGKGQTLLNLQQAEQALACFDEALTVDNTVAEVHLKRGTALERLRRLDEAIASYDQAISLDDSLTAAYLSKANVCNRLERYGEALECYEHALGAQSRQARPANAPPTERQSPTDRT